MYPVKKCSIICRDVTLQIIFDKYGWLAFCVFFLFFNFFEQTCYILLVPVLGYLVLHTICKQLNLFLSNYISFVKMSVFAGSPKAQAFWLEKNWLVV